MEKKTLSFVPASDLLPPLPTPPMPGAHPRRGNMPPMDQWKTEHIQGVLVQCEHCGEFDDKDCTCRDADEAATIEDLVYQAIEGLETQDEVLSALEVLKTNQRDFKTLMSQKAIHAKAKKDGAVRRTRGRPPKYNPVIKAQAGEESGGVKGFAFTYRFHDELKAPVSSSSK